MEILEPENKTYEVIGEDNGILKVRMSIEWKCKCCGHIVMKQHRIIYKKKPEVKYIEW